MADEPKTPPAGESNPTNISPAPADVADKPAEDAAAEQPLAASKHVMPADPLPDGTVPTIIQEGESHRAVPKSKASLTRVYRKADILTTVLTAGGVILAILIISGIYLYFANRNKPKLATPKVTALDQADLNKLGAFFQGNASGSDTEVLTINSSTLFKNRVATNSDLKVVGGAEITGSTILSDLSVTKTANLGIVNINGQLVASGPANIKGNALFGAGASVNGNLAVTGTGSFGGTLSAGTLNVTNLTVTGTLNLAGHISLAGQNPSASPGSEAGAGATATADGNDAAGTVTVNTGTVAAQLPPVGGLLVKVTFRTPYPRAPKVVISADSQASAALQYYVLKTANDFTIGVYSSSPYPLPSSNTSYSFDYWVVQ
ncbi:MAG TPA: hypothetical protein VI322_01815 [Candidatus Saccharimonadia bacterium]